MSEFEDDHSDIEHIEFAYCTEFVIQNIRANASDVDISPFAGALTA